MNVAMFPLAGIVIALCLYILRARARLLYGLLELASGVVVMLGAINSYSAVLGRENVPIVGGGIFHRGARGMATLESSFGCVVRSCGSDLHSRARGRSL
jgi:hypothetical protein